MADFFSRWSARKAAAREGKSIAELDPKKQSEADDKSSTSGAIQTQPVEEASSVLTLDDVAELTPTSDFSGFVAKGVDIAVKNAALKKLFSNPHFNIMDGLDIYIDDYSSHPVLPQSVIDEMTKDGFLNMFQKEETPTEKATAHDDPDLQLQRDDAARREGTVVVALQPPEDAAGLEVAQPAVPPPSA